MFEVTLQNKAFKNPKEVPNLYLPPVTGLVCKKHFAVAKEEGRFLPEMHQQMTIDNRVSPSAVLQCMFRVLVTVFISFTNARRLAPRSSTTPTTESSPELHG